ncbi:cellulose biosynthesis cyclic di-GMP-binding regulatory protein BcsB [Maricaulis sp.]|uniref:cellulose biosynthesis cyclic di-GMP-binding regulatory protein BcsB n=1 Tax=unclassified Maricaulis TaxID=2632371 RepID=UPI001B0FAAEB|nr:cellulose biosynthesis cyclic di-GMP-binding regulatory protein BcsB [Maricaulis sp.]MBO6797161.1 cellulose biosynthesis cyclic di-GMP-binding regulatory protein BcsB [Maricaulis sp.]
MSVRVACAAIALMAVMAGGSLAVETEAETEVLATELALQESVYTEERSLADLRSGMDAFVLSPSQNRQSIAFELPPNAQATEAWLRLAARPASETTTGLIHVSVNGGDPITIRPQARAMEARFALYSGDVRPGGNTLEIEFSTETATAGWIVDASRSQLRLSLERQERIGSLHELEETLASDYAALRRVALISEDNSERATAESLIAQGIALRAGTVPIFTNDIENSDLIVHIAEFSELPDEDLAVLRNPQGAAGPEIAFRNDGTPELIITGRNAEETTAAARLLAARSFEGYQTHFLAADAISASRLGMRQARDARNMAREADLRTFATSGLPFAADQGSRTAVQIVGNGAEDRFGALSVLARAALTSGEAWLYAWYGDGQQVVPSDHNLLVIGPNSTDFAAIDQNAPAELRAALRAAARSQGDRGMMRLAAAAYADDNSAADSNENAPNIGVASLFEDRAQAGRWIGTLTAPSEASFEAAGRSLARSTLWASLEGRAAVWSTRGVTPLDYSISAPTLQERVQEFALDHTRDAAFILFGLAFFMLLRGMWHRRRSVNAS